MVTLRRPEPGSRAKSPSCARLVATALVLGVVSSAGVVAERLTAGDARVAVIATFATAVVAVVAMLALARAPAALARSPGSLAKVALAQGVAVAGGIGLVHGALALVAPAHVTGVLAEVPVQLMNDGVLGAGLLLLAWSHLAASGRVSFGLAMGAFGLLAAYRATASAWHVDAIRFGSLTVQHFVCVELAVVAGALLAVFFASPDSRHAAR